MIEIINNLLSCITKRKTGKRQITVNQYYKEVVLLERKRHTDKYSICCPIPGRGSTYFGWGGGGGTYLRVPLTLTWPGAVPTLAWGYLPWCGGYLSWGTPHPDLAGGTYLGWGVPTLGYPLSGPGQGNTYLGVPSSIWTWPGYPPPGENITFPPSFGCSR